jgi:H+/Na+-translocating ferredoxin:NAD+ oxidoreductase subunit G
VTTEYTASHTSLRTATVMVLFALVFTALMAAIYGLTRPAIEASAEAEKMKLVNEVLPPQAYDNPLLDDTVRLGPTPELGLDAGGPVYRARSGGQPAALVFEAAASDGYSGRIELIVAVLADGRVSGVRVVQHKETPGLGDYIDPRKDKDRARPWITRFDQLSLAAVGEAGWKVRKDGGRFDYHTGATISARAVTNAVARVLAYAAAHRDRLYGAPGSTQL